MVSQASLSNFKRNHEEDARALEKKLSSELKLVDVGFLVVAYVKKHVADEKKLRAWLRFAERMIILIPYKMILRDWLTIIQMPLKLPARGVLMI